LLNWLIRFLTRRKAADSLGNRGEAAAALFLQRMGYQILERQWRSHFGELDLIVLDGDVIAFVEVKTRTSTSAGHPTEAITALKQRNITRSALAYLKRRRWLERRVRFDVISVIWTDAHLSPSIQHYVHAFDSSGRGQMYC